MATINEALKKLFVGLGGDTKELADNETASDYIDDLESAIKACADAASEDIIDDSEASETKVYSSSKVESLIPVIPDPELPAVTSTDNGKILAVVTGAWTKVTITAVADTTSGAVTITLTPDSPTT